MAATAGALLAVAPANAATQGQLSTVSSTGTVGITATIPALIQISGLTDLAFTTLDGVNSAQQTENVCVWTNTAAKNYKITAKGNGASDAFTLVNASNAPIPYSVSWANTSGATSGTALGVNTASASLTTTALTPLCVAGATSTLLVGLSATDQAAMVSGVSYTGTLTLTVSPV